MTQQEIDKLYDANVLELNKMEVGAGSLVQGLLDRLGEPDLRTYIKLHNAIPDGFVIQYDLVGGNLSSVHHVGHGLGFKEVQDNRLEVFSA